MSLLHFSTQPARVAMLSELGIDAVSLDLVTSDDGRRLVENLRSVAWNGIAAAFAALERTWPDLLSPRWSTVKATIIVAMSPFDPSTHNWMNARTAPGLRSTRARHLPSAGQWTPECDGRRRPAQQSVTLPGRVRDVRSVSGATL
jgi:hypothetical protein